VSQNGREDTGMALSDPESAEVDRRAKTPLYPWQLELVFSLVDSASSRHQAGPVNRRPEGSWTLACANRPLPPFFRMVRSSQGMLTGFVPSHCIGLIGVRWRWFSSTATWTESPMLIQLIWKDWARFRMASCVGSILEYVPMAADHKRETRNRTAMIEAMRVSSVNVVM